MRDNQAISIWNASTGSEHQAAELKSARTDSEMAFIADIQTHTGF